MTVDAALEAYIKSRELLSPSTLRGYEAIRRTRFKAISDKDINAVDWQNAINAEAKLCSPKTIKNAWGLFSSALKSAGVDPGEVTLAQVASKDLPWLDYEQIKTFLEAVKYEPCELGALLELHSLRRSEIYALTAADVDLAKGLIRVEGAAVLDADNNLTQKDTNKNETSRRTVPIMIPRLREMLPGAMAATDGGALVQGSLNTLYVQINRVCGARGSPVSASTACGGRLRRWRIICDGRSLRRCGSADGQILILCAKFIPSLPNEIRARRRRRWSSFIPQKSRATKPKSVRKSVRKIAC